MIGEYQSSTLMYFYLVGVIISDAFWPIIPVIEIYLKLQMTQSFQTPSTTHLIQSQFLFCAIKERKKTQKGFYW